MRADPIPMHIAQYQPIQNTQNCLLQKNSNGESHRTPRRNPKSPHFLKRRLMYIENKDGEIDGANGRIGWVSFSKTGKTVYYRGRELYQLT